MKFLYFALSGTFFALGLLTKESKKDDNVKTLENQPVEKAAQDETPPAENDNQPGDNDE